MFKGEINLRKKELYDANDELFRRNEELLLKIADLKKVISNLKDENQELEMQNRELDMKLNSTNPLRDLEKKVTSRVSVSKETEYAATVIGKIVVIGAKYCNILTALPESSITKEQVNLILGRTEVAKAEILKITESDIEFDDKKIAMDAKAVEVEEYFNSIMAQSE